MEMERREFIRLAFVYTTKCDEQIRVYYILYMHEMEGMMQRKFARNRKNDAEKRKNISKSKGRKCLSEQEDLRDDGVKLC